MFLVIKKGHGGQAIIRSCENAIGIPTKKFPSHSHSALYVDAEYADDCKKILFSIELLVKAAINKNGSIIFPEDGFGTGLAKLHIYAPKTLEFLNKLIYECFDINYNFKEN